MERCRSRRLVSDVCRLLTEASRVPLHSRSVATAVLVALLLSLLLALTACGGSSVGRRRRVDARSAAAAAFPVTVTGDNGELTLDAQPETIVSMSATRHRDALRHRRRRPGRGRRQHLELPRRTCRPPTCRPSPPTPRRSPTYEPDLVVLSDDLNGIVDALDALQGARPCCSAPPQTLDDSYEQLDDPRRRDRSRRRGRDGRRRHAGPDRRRRRRRCAATPKGMTRLPRARPDLLLRGELARSSAASTRCSAWRTSPTRRPTPPAATRSCPPSTSSAQAPDLIVLADTVCCDQTAETLAQRPAFDTVPAVKDGPGARGQRRHRLPLGSAGRRLRRVGRRRR